MLHSVASMLFQELSSTRDYAYGSRSYSVAAKRISCMCFNPRTETNFVLLPGYISKTRKMPKTGAMLRYVIKLELDKRKIPNVQGYVICADPTIETKWLQRSFRARLGKDATELHLCFARTGGKTLI